MAQSQSLASQLREQAAEGNRGQTEQLVLTSGFVAWSALNSTIATFEGSRAFEGLDGGHVTFTDWSTQILRELWQIKFTGGIRRICLCDDDLMCCSVPAQNCSVCFMELCWSHFPSLRKSTDFCSLVVLHCGLNEAVGDLVGCLIIWSTRRCGPAMKSGALLRQMFEVRSPEGLESGRPRPAVRPT